MQTSKGKIINKKFTKGFTLLELLVIVIIIGILAAISLPQYQKAVAKTDLMRTITYVKSLADAQERYFLTNGEYSISKDNLDISVPISIQNLGCYLDKNIVYCISSKGLIYLQFVQNQASKPGQIWCGSRQEKFDDLCKNVFPEATVITDPMNSWFPQLNVHKGWRVK